jgi:uncharacterized membrane protein YfcA
MTAALIVAIVLFAAVVQGLAGFGFAVIIMPLITLLLGLQTAAPMVALTALTVYSINLIRFRRAIDLGVVLRLGVASAFGVPIGIWLLANVDEALVKRLLGLLLSIYAIYALARPTASWMPSRLWIYPTGFFAGCLGGAYNTPGPPAIVYGQLRRWPRDEFRAVLQALFFVNAALVVFSHSVAHHMTVQVLVYYLCALPALVVGILIAARVDHRVNRERFRTMVTVMILLLGLLLVSGMG